MAWRCGRVAFAARAAGLASMALLAAGAGPGAAALGAEAPTFGPARIVLGGEPAPPASASVCGFALVAHDEGPQVALEARPPAAVVSVQGEEAVVAVIPLEGLAGPFTVSAEAALVHGDGAEVSLGVGQAGPPRTLGRGEAVRLEASGQGGAEGAAVRLATRARGGEAAVRWRRLRLKGEGGEIDIPLDVPAAPYTGRAPRTLPDLRPPAEEALIEWDWRMQDGIGTQREPTTYAAAVERVLARGGDLLRDLRGRGVGLADEATAWERLRQERRALAAAGAADEEAWEDLWRRAHALRRRIALANPLARTGPLLFVKQVPGAFSHQLTQYYGRYARPGGGVFVLDRPGESMRCRRLGAGAMPEGSCQHLDVSCDGRRILFAFCEVDQAPADSIQGHRGRYFHLWEMAADGSGARPLTDGPFDDFAPRYLPDGRIVFISTRRRGWHRCGNPGCENYTLAVAEADGSGARPISWHETQEWDPAVLDDGRVIYTRWDYVDRHAVYYEQLWAVRPDGSAPAAYYGNNTFNPVGIWEARQVPGSSRVIATAGAHHAMTAGSIVLVDVGRGVDGPAPIARLTPDAPFPESEALLLPGWRGSVPVEAPPEPPEARRWPGHCYRSPYPLSETYFLAAYSFDALVGEPKANAPNLFGLYLVDAFGNKELLYRDLNVASVWPMPLRPRPRPPVLASAARDSDGGREGTFFLQDVYESDPAVPRGSIKRLRIVQVLPKSTPGANNPPVGLANASPGKQVLGTVPVEADGSAYFRAPAGVPLSFQALDELGRAVQIMRSITYLQPGECASCVGCHEPRLSAPPRRPVAEALVRGPSPIAPAPAGSSPLSYPILVQPVLDQRCIACHRAGKADGGVVLTGEPQGHYTASYNALAPRVPFSAWTGSGNFRAENSEPVSTPGYFGARASPLMRMLLGGHEKVVLTPAEIERLVTWMDANALFYGTFDPADQARQQRGEPIRGPALE